MTLHVYHELMCCNGHLDATGRDRPVRVFILTLCQRV